MQLLPGQYTPQIQELMTRLGSKLPFQQAAEEVWLNQRTHVDEATLRGVTHRYGQIAETIARVEAERIEREAPEQTATPEKLLVSADGAFVHLTTGEWREIKTMVIGEFASVWQERKGKVEVKTTNLSYFSRSYRIREFEQYALAELHRRGVDNARLVATVNDGSDWIQSFTDYHFPQAIRILDFRHAAGYVADAGKAAFGEGSPQFGQWYHRVTHQLKHKPPRQTIADICFLTTKAQTDEALATIDQARHYLQKREKLIDYPFFRARGLPIGSGSAESSHKVVVHSRMKLAGMRWAEHHVDAMLALRNLVCNGLWSPGWSHIVAHYWQQRRLEFKEKAKRQCRHGTPLPNDRVEHVPIAAQPASPKPPPKKKGPHRPAPDHPWRLDVWPSIPSWSLK